MPNDLDIPFDRVTYRDGQLLATQDLRDEQRNAFRRNALHTRYLHETWGVALGFEVRLLENASEVAIGPGHAVDQLGRDILLAKSVKVAVPHVGDPERFALTVRYQDDPAFRDRRELAAVCLSDGLSPRNERPAFAWLRPGEVQFGIEVPLASVVAEGGRVIDGPQLRVRRTARPFLRPHIGWGETEAGRTGWQFSDMGLSVDVDTSAAGFSNPPFYFAQVLGDFSRDEEYPDSQLVAFGRGACIPLGGSAYITRSSQTGFTLRVRAHLANISKEQAEQCHWRVGWIGLEPVKGCEPSFDLSQLSAFVGPLAPARFGLFF